VQAWRRGQAAPGPEAVSDDPEREARLRELEGRAAARQELFAGTNGHGR
jgi:hypothetical protein